MSINKFSGSSNTIDKTIRERLRITGETGTQFPEPQRYILPNRLKLMGRDIEVQYIDKEHVSNMGMYVEKKNLIQIDNSMHPAVQERTLIHEVMHSILIDLGEEELNANEGFVERIANMVHLFIKENKEVLA